MFKEILLNNFITIVATVFAIFTFIRCKGLPKRITTLFMVSILVFSVLIIADSLDYYMSMSFETLNNWRYVTSIIGYSLKPSALIFILLTLMRNDEKGKIKFLLFIPISINFIICVISPFAHTIFYFTQNNNFVRGPLWFFPFLTAAVYFVTLIILTIQKHKFIDKNELVLIALIALVVICSTTIELVWEAKYIINGAGVISIIFYYLFLHTQVYKRDTLTGLLNRNSFYSDIESISSNVYIVCLDMNSLKKINDTEGHDAGDKALVTIADCIRNNLSRKDEAYRVGGDEFCILIHKDEKSTQKDVEAISDLIKQNFISVAYGYELYTGKENFDAVYKKADAKMYKLKNQMKREEKKAQEQA